MWTLSAQEQQAAASLHIGSKVVKRWWRVARIWFEGEEKWKARGYAVGVVALSLLTTVFYVRISYVERRFSTALTEKDVARFSHAIWEFVGIILIAAPFFTFSNWLKDMLVLSWRQYLTTYVLNAYFSDRAFFNVRQIMDSHAPLDNPDQRICDDVASFVGASTNITLTIIDKVFNCIAFTGVLWSISPGMVGFLLLYAGTGTLITTYVFSRILMHLQYRLLRSEADMRFSLIRVREYAESIAFYNGERREHDLVVRRLALVISTVWHKIRWGALYDLWVRIYSYSTILIPSLLTAPRYFAGEIEFGVVTQAGIAFSRIDSALAIIVNSLEAFANLAVETDRLEALLSALLSCSSQAALADSVTKCVQRSDSSVQQGLALEKLTFSTPGGIQLICRDLSLTTGPGESLLIVGPSGCGKSSLLRVISGLWNEGSGTVRSPPHPHVFFLPQKPFMPLGNLRQQLLFPSGDRVQPAAGPHQLERAPAGGAGDASEEGAVLVPLLAHHGEDVRASSDARLLALLDEVRLPGLAAKVGGLDAELDWSHVLSVGEQQRVAFARLLLHRPALAFLDEATSALDPPTELVLYSLLQQHCSCYVSIGHRPQLVKFHSHVLECKEDGSWEKLPAAEWSSRVELKSSLAT